jgi:hypothetical protein
MLKNVKYCYELHNGLMSVRSLNNVSNKYSSAAGESSMRVDESIHVSMLILEPRFFQEAINMFLFSNFNLYGETSSVKLFDLHCLLVM